MVSLPSGRVILARHTTPGGEIQLQQRPLPDGSLAFEIISDGVFLMASYNQASERALARYALDALESGPASGRRLLVGGLGMGFTLQESLGRDVAAVDVVEISPHIIEWNRIHFAALNGDVLADPRVRLIRDDVYNLLPASPRPTYDTIVLDVDNGPSWLAHPANARLYTAQALERWAAWLMPGGAFAVWSAQAEPTFLERMRTAFGRTEELPLLVPGHTREPVEHFVYRGVPQL